MCLHTNETTYFPISMSQKVCCNHLRLFQSRLNHKPTNETMQKYEVEKKIPGGEINNNSSGFE